MSGIDSVINDLEHEVKKVINSRLNYRELDFVLRSLARMIDFTKDQMEMYEEPYYEIHICNSYPKAKITHFVDKDAAKAYVSKLMEDDGIQCGWDGDKLSNTNPNVSYNKSLIARINTQYTRM